MTEDEMEKLREDIKERYEECRSENDVKYRPLKFNSYPKKYEYLRTSIKEELLRRAQADANQAIEHTPSNKTFAKIFYDKHIIKDEDVLDTLYLYARGMSRKSFIALQEQTVNIDPATPPSGLVINSPRHSEIVPRQLLAEGKVTNASMVWLVVRPVGGVRYWVQPEAQVKHDGTWVGPLYIGSTDPGDIGIKSQIRAFVNPITLLREGLVLHSWPEAQLSSEIIEVIRGEEKE